MTDTLIKEPAKKTLTKDEFMSRIMPKTKTLSYPTLGGDIVVRSISAEDRDEIQSASTDIRTGKTKESILIALTLVKGLVEPKLSPVEVDALKKSDFTLIMNISNEIWTLSGGLDQLKKG